MIESKWQATETQLDTKKCSNGQTEKQKHIRHIESKQQNGRNKSFFISLNYFQLNLRDWQNEFSYKFHLYAVYRRLTLDKKVQRG